MLDTASTSQLGFCPWLFEDGAVPVGCPEAAEAVHAARTLCAVPFDLARAQHATAVQFGLLPRSLLEDRDFELGLARLEHFLLGPLARSV
jgi:hypothetical protein